ncbi:hypothetical protein GGR57DRAFT_518795 [Xylariaceae sp. FL1272]|nr:hypothetical protein GGR57DRAFT_518795 [Xylariaceae sp. FL1272]
MPLLYGEKDKAFIRLQHEIVKVSDDHSILTWDINDSTDPPVSGAFAPTPGNFRYCGSIVPDEDLRSKPIATTSMGISMTVSLMETQSPGILYARLNCVEEFRGVCSSKSDRPIPTQKKCNIWIPIRSTSHLNYFRIHHPVPKMYLSSLYGARIPKISALILLGTNPSQFGYWWDLQKHHVQTVPTISLPQRSGLVVSVGCGQTQPVTGMFSKVYHFGRIFNAPLRAQGYSALSHQLVASGSFAIVISVFWNRSLSPEDWNYTILADGDLSQLSHLASLSEWACLFQAGRHHHPAHCCTSASSLHLLHNRLKNASGKTSGTDVNPDLLPLVRMERGEFRNLLGQPGALVEVVFREFPGQ